MRKYTNVLWHKSRSFLGRLKEIVVDKNKIRLFILVGSVLLSVCLGFYLSSLYSGSQFRIIYSLDKKQNDKEIVKVIEDADRYVYFAIYYFTNKNIASALIKAKNRGLIVEGITDNEASSGTNKEIVSDLRSAGIKVLTQKHKDGIMHLKVIVTDDAYASGSYNWTQSATLVNDEILEIGTKESVRKKYLEIIGRVLKNNDNNQDPITNNPSFAKATKGEQLNTKVDLGGEAKEYDYREAMEHIGEEAIVKGKVIKVYTSKSGTTFLDFCKDYSKCPFTAVIFASDADKFSNLKQYEREVRVRGVIKSYNGKAEIIVESPEQLM